MPAFLRLNGVTATVADETARTARVPVGESGRSVAGTAWRDWRAVKGQWEGVLVLAASDTARAWRDLLLGQHDVWSHEGNHLYSAKGVPLTVDTGVAVSAAQAKFGVYSLSVPTTKGFFVNFSGAGWDPNVKPWTVAWWQREGTTWYHYLETSAGGKWRAGAVSGHVAFWAKSASVLTYGPQSSGGTYYVDDLVVLPFVVPSTWPAAMAAFGAAVPDAPKLAADGLLIENNVAGGATVLGEVDSDPLALVRLAGVAAPNAQPVSFRLVEV